MKNQLIVILMVLPLSSCSGNFLVDGADVSLFAWSGLSWKWVHSDLEEPATRETIYEEQFGDGNTLRLHQSMCVYEDIAFCFNDGDECRVYNIHSKERLYSEPLPQTSHHNNAQFSHYFYDDHDQYPLLILSRGDYPPNQNDFYVVRVSETDGMFDYSVVKTIHNSIVEAQYGGSWVIDEEHERLFLYCMTAGDWRTKENNRFCVLSFRLPDISNPEDVTLSYDDVLERWEYTYLIGQGGTYFNGYLFFNVESLETVDGKKVVSPKSVIAVNVSNGHVEVVLPLDDTKETEGICVFNNKLYVSFKEGTKDQSPASIVFTLNEYSLPESIINSY